ncbi:MAG TPA: hypothetical protein VK081_09280, partial [Planctomycetota bacterium]|nr:hypothetical protein [Planctomycetota bacterium]
DADKTRPYAMWLFVGSDKEPYMGLEQNLAPDEKRSLLFYKSAASWHATINGEEVILYDSNADGRLMTSDPYQFGLQVPNVEPGKMTTVPAYDCMQVGRKGAVQPFSEYAKIGDKWFHLRPAKDGAAISARAVVPEFLPTGTLQMKWTGPRSTHVHCLVVRGEGNLSVAAFNLASGKPVEVPAGSYVIDFGRVSEGKGSTMVTADILRGESEPIRVEAGATTVVTIGAPFTFAFEKTPQGTDVEIDAHKIRVLGAAREHYLRLNGCVPEIDVLFAKDEKGRGQKVVGSFGPVPDHDVATRLNAEFRDIGYYNPMFPIVKGAKERLTVLRFTPAGEGFVALRTAKSKVFGKIESAWK